MNDGSFVVTAQSFRRRFGKNASTASTASPARAQTGATGDAAQSASTTPIASVMYIEKRTVRTFEKSGRYATCSHGSVTVWCPRTCSHEPNEKKTANAIATTRKRVAGRRQRRTAYHARTTSAGSP